MSFELDIAARHLSARRSKALSFVTGLAIAGVALGVAALIGGFAVTSGFEIAFREKVLGFSSHIFVREFGVRFTTHREVDALILAVDGVTATSPMTFNEAMVSGRTGTQGAVIKGIEPNRVRGVLTLDRYVVEGSLDALSLPVPDGIPAILLGRELARKTGVKVGELVTLVSPLRRQTAESWGAEARTPSSGTFRVGGIVQAGFHEYDARLAFVALGEAQRFFGLGDVITGFEVAVDDVLASDVVTDVIRERLGPDEFSVMDWRQQNRNLFASLFYQRIAILVVLSVLVVLASCLVACILVMRVMERTREIAILKTMGARQASILWLFITQGGMIGAVGTAFGVVLAFVFCQGLLANGVELDPKVYGISQLPIVFDIMDYVMGSVGAMVISLLATVLPAWAGSKLHPVDGLRAIQGS